LSREEAAALLGLKSATLEAWACRGGYGLPYIRVGGRAKYKRQDIDEFISRRSGTSASEINRSLNRLKQPK
jgi:excisionase family DNA binding protein